MTLKTTVIDPVSGNESISTFGSIGLQAPLPGRANVPSPPDESEEARIQARLAAVMQPLPGIVDAPTAAGLPPLLNPLALMQGAADYSVMTTTSSSDAGKSFLIVDGKTPTPALLSTTPPFVVLDDVHEAVPTLLGSPGAPPAKLMRVPSPAASLTRGGGGSMSDGESYRSGLVTPNSMA